MYSRWIPKKRFVDLLKIDSNALGVPTRDVFDANIFYSSVKHMFSMGYLARPNLVLVTVQRVSRLIESSDTLAAYSHAVPILNYTVPTDNICSSQPDSVS
uniref:Uncharacterized protein n=1 Tax=Cacopsylla melanoneura TaxID=428564 RepID=A0A8D9E5R1_9HEMI